MTERNGRVEVCRLEVSHEYIMRRTLSQGYRLANPDDIPDQDCRDIPHGFLHAVIDRLFEEAGHAVDEAMDNIISELHDEWGLEIAERPEIELEADDD